MRKVIAIVILIGLGVLVYFNPSIYNKRNVDEIDGLADGIIEEEDILPLARAISGDTLDFRIEDIQRTPDQIVKFNAMVMKVMYRYGKGVTPLTEEEIGLLIDLQRLYYHEELLAINDRDFQLIGAVREIEKAREAESWIVDYRVESPVYDKNDSDIAVVEVTFIPSSLGESTDIHHRYLVERDSGLWYIKGWVGYDDITVE